MTPLPSCASLSIDLDNEWAYLKSRGDQRWRTYPSYLTLVVPRILALLRKRDVTITFFVVGKDAEYTGNHEALASISAAGHEIGNHSLQHDLGMHRYTEEQFRSELIEAEQRLLEVTGQRPRGFRGPGFSYSDVTLRVLAQHGYLYHASTLPSFLGPIARTYHIWKSRLSHEERSQLRQLFGGWSEGLRPLKPYRWSLGHGSLIEIPVTTFPVIRFPIHLTYVMYLAGLSPRLAGAYFESAIGLCRLFQIEPSILLHPIEFMTGHDIPSLAAFPGMRLDERDKQALLESCLDCLQENWPVVSLERHAIAIAQRKDLPIFARY